MTIDKPLYRRHQVTSPTTQPASLRDLRERKTVRLLIAIFTVVVLSITILVIAAFATGRGGDETATGAASAKEHSVSAPASGRQEGRFEILSGAETLVVRCGDTGTDLYQATTPQNGSLVPQAVQNGDLTQLSLVASGTTGPASADVLLNSSVRWHLKMVGGGMTQTIQCAGGNLSEIELGQGAGTIDAALPPARGTVPVRLVGGAGHLKIHLPGGLPVQVKIGAGAGVGTVKIDGQLRTDVQPGSELTPPEWNSATDRYVVDAAAGLASLTVDRQS